MTRPSGRQPPWPDLCRDEGRAIAQCSGPEQGRCVIECPVRSAHYVGDDESPGPTIAQVVTDGIGQVLGLGRHRHMEPIVLQQAKVQVVLVRCSGRRCGSSQSRRADKNSCENLFHFFPSWGLLRLYHPVNGLGLRCIPGRFSQVFHMGDLDGQHVLDQSEFDFGEPT